jgi:hypothetical protein
MGFEILTHQVQAIAAVTQSLGGQVSSAYGRMSLGHMASAMLGAQLMLGDALRLAAILDGVDFLQDLDLAPKEEVSPDNSGAYILMLKDLDASREEVELLEEVIAELEQALLLLQAQVGVVETLTRNIEQMSNAAEGADGLLGEALTALREQVLPQLYDFQDRLAQMLEHYQDALRVAEGNLWYLETVFKFILPFVRALKRRRQARLRQEQDEAAREGQDNAADPLQEAVEEAMREAPEGVNADTLKALGEAALKKETSPPQET